MVDAAYAGGGRNVVLAGALGRMSVDLNAVMGVVCRRGLIGTIMQRCGVARLQARRSSRQ